MTRSLNHLDVVKGLSIISLALYHSRFSKYVPEFAASMKLFRVPLFFFVAGAFFSGYRVPLEGFLRRFQLLIKPYLVVVLFAIVLLAFRDDNTVFRLKAMAWGDPAGVHIALIPVWFLPHLFVLTVAATLLMNTAYARVGHVWRWMLIVALLLFGVLIIQHYWPRGIRVKTLATSLNGLPWGLDFLPVSLAIFLAGYQFREAVFGFRPRWMWVILALIAYGLALYGTNAVIDLNRRLIRSPVAVAVGIMCGIYLFMSLGHALMSWRWGARYIGLVGQCSLYVLLFHMSIQVAVDGAARALAGGARPGLWVAMIGYALSILLSTALGVWIQRTPFARALFAPAPKAGKSQPSSQASTA